MPRSIKVRTKLFLTAALCLALAGALIGEDVVELVSGAKARGTIVSIDDKQVVMKVRIGSQTLSRTYPKDRVAAVVRNGKREEYQPGKDTASKSVPSKTGPAKPGAPQSKTTGPDDAARTKAEIDKLIDTVGRQPPDWYDATPLNYPQSLDLTWPQPAPAGWNNQKNVGQFVWDVINPNPGKWREGVKLMHHILSTNARNKPAQLRAMNELGRMYHNLLSDYARAAFWWRLAKVDSTNDFPGSSVHLAECYWRLGNKALAVELADKLRHSSVVKLWADMGETDKALQLAESLARGGAPEIAYVHAGDACRVVGRLDDAIAFYDKVLKVPATGQRKDRIAREQNRARASLEAIRLFEKCDLSRVPDGTYSASSLGYEGQVQVEVVVSDHKIASLKVTQHREKQFYNAIAETPARIIARQGVQGVDTTSSATITSEAIINAAAKALAGGAK